MYEILILPQAKKDLDSFRGKIFNQIKNRILSLSKNPRPPGCLKLTAEEGYRLRYGNYRIIYRINDEKNVIYIYRIKHRKESYK
jgi:mRNA interferase RelE/StbE